MVVVPHTLIDHDSLHRMDGLFAYDHRQWWYRRQMFYHFKLVSRFPQLYVCMYVFICLRRLSCIWQHEADVDPRPVNTHNEQRPDHNTGNSAPYSFR